MSIKKQPKHKIFKSQMLQAIPIPVAELVLGLTLDVLRKISFGNQSVRLGEEVSIIQGNEIKGKTVGIIGTRNIGLETARLFKAFGAKLIGYNRSEKE